MAAIVGDLAQTFFLDYKAVGSARKIYLSEIDLFFRTKPTTSSTSSGLPKPGVTLYITETKLSNGMYIPDLENPVEYGRSRVIFDNINTSFNAGTATTFRFTRTPLDTQKTYALVIKFDGNDTGFTLWRNKGDEVLDNAPKPNVTQGALDGYFFVLTSSSVATPQMDVDLKFALRINTFATNSNTTYQFINRNFEMLPLIDTSMQGSFMGGEYVFANTTTPTGQTINISATSKVVTGTGTTFLSTHSNNSLIILKNGNDHSVRKVVSISNNTYLTMDYEAPFTNTAAKYIIGAIGSVYTYAPDTSLLVLTASSANDTHNFIANSSWDQIIGVTSEASARINRRAVGTVDGTNYFTDLGALVIDEFLPDIKYTIPQGTDVTTSVKLTGLDYNTSIEEYAIDNGKRKRFTNYPAYLFSRSDEVAYGDGSIGLLENLKSINFKATFSTSNKFTSPFLDEQDIGFFAYQRNINNDLTNEHTNRGNAIAKYISKRVTLADGQESEDIRVYLTAYRPFGTNITVYGKFYNRYDPEGFETKNWTRLQSITSNTIYSSSENIRDYYDIEYKLPTIPLYTDLDNTVVGPKIDGVFTGSNGSKVLVGTAGNVNTFINEDDLVRIYNPLFPDYSLVSVVTASNTTTLTIDTTLSTANTRLNDFCRPGLIAEKVEYKNVAFKNYTANGVIRYYNSEMSAFDTFDAFAVKIVLQGDMAGLTYPHVADMRAIALSV